LGSCIAHHDSWPIHVDESQAGSTTITNASHFAIVSEHPLLYQFFQRGSPPLSGRTGEWSTTIPSSRIALTSSLAGKWSIAQDETKHLMVFIDNAANQARGFSASAELALLN
jgi:hypothetical protein